MKNLILSLGIIAVLTSCGGANDGDAKTDTTTMPVDTAMNATYDTANRVNTSGGTYSLDSSSTKGDVRSSSSATDTTPR